MTYIGNEPFLVGGNVINLTVNDFWRWAYSDLINNIERSALAEFIVASSLETTSLDTERARAMWRSYGLLSKEGYRVEVKSAAYVQSWDAKHPDFISFGIAPARLMDEAGNYKQSDPPKRNSDVYIFCVYTAQTKAESPLDLDLWDFYVLPTRVLDEKKPAQKTITLPSLMRLDPVWCDYYGIGDAIRKTMTV